MITTQSARRNVILAIAAAAVLCLIYWPALRWMVNSWISSDYYSHGFLVPVISVYFIWTKREQLKNREPSFFGVLWIISGVLLYVLSFIWQFRVPGIISLILVIVGLVFAVFGTRTFKTLIFPLGFLLFMVPFWFVQDLAYELQFLSVHWSAWITQVIGLPVITSGTEIHLGDIGFTVGIVCSGINTLVALLALAAVYAYVLKGHIAKRWGLFGLAIPIAIGANILRIASIIVVAYFFNVETATGWYHDLSSPLFFFLAFGVLILLAHLMKLRFNYAIMGRQ